MLKLPKNILIFLILIFSYFFTSSYAFALTCYLGSDQTAVTDTENMPKVAYIAGKQDGEKLWESKTFTRTVSCSSYITDGTENVYLYPFPKRAAENFPIGVKIGLILNGQDLGTFEQYADINAGRVDTGWTVGNTATQKTMTFKFYFIKSGEVSFVNNDMLTIFQLDGAGGLNSIADANYNIKVTGLKNMARVNCTQTNANVSALKTLNTHNVFYSSATSHTFNDFAKLAIRCSSVNSSIFDGSMSIEGKLTLSGSKQSGNYQYFATNRNNFGLKVEINGTHVYPDNSVAITVPLSYQDGYKTIAATITPYLSAYLSTADYPWLFSSDDHEVNSDISLSFTPEEITFN